jgi:DNA polymerase-3 subunit delta
MARQDDFSRILNDLKRKEYKPVYFLHGVESYFIDAVSDAIENDILSEMEKAFNLTVVYGKEVDFKAVIDSARRYPMGAERQVVILKEAQGMKDIAELQSYIEKPSPTTIMAICYRHKKLDMRTAFGKAVKKHAEVLEAKPIYDNQVPDWIESYLRGKKVIIRPGEAALVAEYLGSDLSKVANELDKLALNLEKGSTVSADDVERYIGISREYNTFELQKAIGFRDAQKAMRIVRNFAANPKKHPLVVTIGTLYNYFSKVYLLHEVAQQPEKEILRALKLSSGFFLKEYRQTMRNYPIGHLEKTFSILAEYDRKSKGINVNGTNVPDSELLREMVWKILH